MAPLVIDQNSSRSPTDVGQIPYKNVGHRSTSSFSGAAVWLQYSGAGEEEEDQGQRKNWATTTNRFRTCNRELT